MLKKHKLLFLFHMILVEEQLFFWLSTNFLAHLSGCIIHCQASHFVCHILEHFFFWQQSRHLFWSWRSKLMRDKGKAGGVGEVWCRVAFEAWAPWWDLAPSVHYCPRCHLPLTGLSTPIPSGFSLTSPHLSVCLSVCLSLSEQSSLTSFSFSETKFKRNFSSCNWLRYCTDKASGCCTLQTDWGSDLEELGNSWSRFWVFTIAEELFNNLKRSSEKVFCHSFQVLVNLGARMFLELTHVQRVPWQTDNMGWASKVWTLKVGELYLSGRTSVPAIRVPWQYSRWDSEKHCSVEYSWSLTGEWVPSCTPASTISCKSLLSSLFSTVFCACTSTEIPLVIFQKMLKKLLGLEMLYVICLEMKRFL